MRKVTDRHDLSTGRELFALFNSTRSDSLSKLLDNFLLHKVSHSLLVSHEHVERLYLDTQLHTKHSQVATRIPSYVTVIFGPSPDRETISIWPCIYMPRLYENTTLVQLGGVRILETYIYK